MTDAQNAAFYGFSAGAHVSLALLHFLHGYFGWSLFFVALAAFSALGVFVFTVELKSDRKPTPTTNLNEKV